MNVICLEGPHGSGKSSLTKQFEQIKVPILDEAFLDLPKYALHPQSLTMEVQWVSNWFQRILKKNYELQKNRTEEDPIPLFIADRSPFSAVYYASNGEVLENVMRIMIDELKEKANINIVTVYMKTEKELLWKRVLDRVEKEPERKKLNEHSRKFLDTTVEWYDKFRWDKIVENNDQSLKSLRKQLLTMAYEF
ncbi:deoxynucleoside kinase [Anaeramoeba flamelloides]|uniref:Deoxynucleoside kinase n=1 Tax=Anaeramoeba flamelloides TaxID=1746091 RepID=A0AAV7ZAW9_9EUKA|nr:deoxynucleoside kinase [Anaeramoeba flamelloides]KAJ6244080.1 deoxynucleoside kinase [Anaeramoeba flamelloides]|eukprot:Anaeramoba_flamelloidesa88626_28.p1 GENE.a88626_28~~a88626_28.p1  ORF type:complete len:193 (+),score=45.98 a88626_28:23-601(+)